MLVHLHSCTPWSRAGHEADNGPGAHEQQGADNEPPAESVLRFTGMPHLPGCALP